MEKLLSLFGTAYRYPTLAMMLLIILIVWIAGGSLTSTEGLLYYLLAFLAYRFDREVNRQRAINTGFDVDAYPDSYIRAMLYVIKKKEKDLENAEAECRSFKNMYFQQVKEMQAAKAKAEEKNGDA